MKKNLTLEYKDIRLRNIKASDIDDYIKWYEDEENWQSMNKPLIKKYLDIDELKEDLKKDIKKEEIIQKRFEIDYKDQHTGWIRLYYTDPEEDMLSLKIVIPEPSNWGKGIGEKALTCIFRYIFSKDPYRTFSIEICEENKRMLNLAKKLGFKEDPLLRRMEIVNDKCYTILVYKLVNKYISRYRI